MNFSFWEQQQFFTSDVVVVGSGIVGLSAAYYIQQEHPNWRVVVLERGFLPMGASTKNAGFACFGSLSELIEQKKQLGEKGLYNLVERRWKGLNRLRKLLGDKNIGYQNCGGFELFDEQYKEVEEACLNELSYFNNLLKDIIGHPQIFSAAKEKVATFGFGNTTNLIENKWEGQLHTGKMMWALRQKAASLGVVVYNNCTVQKIESIAQGAKVYTNQGNFKCRHVLLATNAFSQQLIKELEVVPGRGQVLITKPISSLKVCGTFHCDKGFYYFRNVGNRLLLGGGRNIDFEAEHTTEFGLTEKIQQRLIEMLQKVILPHIPFEIEMSWSGIMGFGKELTPIIKECRPHVYCAVRGSGMGIAIGTQTGYDLAALCDDD